MCDTFDCLLYLVQHDGHFSLIDCSKVVARFYDGGLTTQHSPHAGYVRLGCSAVEFPYCTTEIWYEYKCILHRRGESLEACSSHRVSSR